MKHRNYVLNLFFTISLALLFVGGLTFSTWLWTTDLNKLKLKPFLNYSGIGHNNFGQVLFQPLAIDENSEFIVRNDFCPGEKIYYRTNMTPRQVVSFSLSRHLRVTWPEINQDGTLDDQSVYRYPYIEDLQVAQTISGTIGRRNVVRSIKLPEEVFITIPGTKDKVRYSGEMRLSVVVKNQGIQFSTYAVPFNLKAEEECQ